jgi:hypothetical protein
MGFGGREFWSSLVFLVRGEELVPLLLKFVLISYFGWLVPVVELRVVFDAKLDVADLDEDKDGSDSSFARSSSVSAATIPPME